MNYLANRREQLIKKIDGKMDGCLITNPIHVGYLTGFSGDSSYLLIGKDTLMMISDSRYEQQIKEECPDVSAHIRPATTTVTAATAEIINKMEWRTIGLESTHVTLSEYSVLHEQAKTVHWRPVANLVESIRIIKDSSEIDAIRQAIGMAERAFVRFRASLQPMDTEKQLADRLEMLQREEGATCSSFPAIVGVDRRAALPHAPLTQQAIGEGELLLVDWGAKGAFYYSDMTRTFALRNITPKLQEVYQAVLNAQRQAVEAIQPGVQAKEIEAVARASLEQAGLNEYFTHSLGHGLGREVHEMPFIRMNTEIQLQPGMIFTVEPGVYLPEWGGVRIEDDVLVTEDGCEVLTSIPKELEEMIIDFG